MPEMQSYDLKSELEAVKQLSLSHVGHTKSSRRQSQILHNYNIQQQHDFVRQQLAETLQHSRKAKQTCGTIAVLADRQCLAGYIAQKAGCNTSENCGSPSRAAIAATAALSDQCIASINSCANLLAQHRCDNTLMCRRPMQLDLSDMLCMLTYAQHYYACFGKKEGQRLFTQELLQL